MPYPDKYPWNQGQAGVPTRLNNTTNTANTTSGAVITPGGDLPASFIIHVVTSSDEEPESAGSVERALRNGLRRASEWGLNALSIPAMGMGAGRMDAESAARAQVDVLVDHLDSGHPPLQLTLVVRSQYEADLFRRMVGELTRERFPMRNQPPAPR